MISSEALVSLRIAATLTHSLPGLDARIRAGSTILCDVRNVKKDEPPEPGPVDVVTPCAFRGAVARAFHEHETGDLLSLLHPPPGVKVAIDITAPSGGVELSGGIYRLPLHGRRLWAFATTLDAEIAHRLGRPIVEETSADLDVATLGLRPDTATGVTVAYAETTALPCTPAEAAVVDLLERLMARWTTAEFLESLDGEHHDRNGL